MKLKKAITMVAFFNSTTFSFSYLLKHKITAIAIDFQNHKSTVFSEKKMSLW